MGIFRRKPKQEFVLGDAELLHREHPETFLIPTRAERDALRPGDLVKLQFELLEPSGDDGTAERMWVRVHEAEAGRYVGTLDNEPILLESIVLGDRVEFGPEHVLALWEDDPAEDDTDWAWDATGAYVPEPGMDQAEGAGSDGLG